MKKIIPILFPIALFAQTGNTVTVSQSAAIAQLMNLYRAYNKKNDLADGYRLQIMFSNDRNEAYNAKSKLYKQFPRETCYVIYEQPYYKLRVGDFTNRFEATDMLNQMLSSYTGAFIVKDKVKNKITFRFPTYPENRTMSPIVPNLATFKILAEKYFDRVVQLRRAIHAHPELAYEEESTANIVRTELANLGWKLLPPIAKTGVVALLECKQPELRCIGLRADMDALPIQEQNTSSYASVHAGKMHACGHDAHTANLLGVAMILGELRNELTGTYKLIFQPSEEKMPSGAAAMIAEGVLLHPTVDKMLGWHVHPEMQAGEVGFKSGKFMASADEIYLTIIGKGGHAAQPQQFISPLIISAEILLALQQYTDIQKPVVLTFGKIVADGATNVVPDKAHLAGTLRCFDEQQRKAMHEVIQQTCESIAKKHNAVCEVNIVVGYPVLVNNETLTQQCIALASDYLGKAKVFDLPQRMGAEDFAFYSHHVPVCFYRVGVGNSSKAITSPIHSPTFDIDEEALKTNVGLMSWLAINA